MKQIWPDYYPEFSCIAHACKHTCCAGWEIDVDREALAYYQTLDGEIGKRLRKHIQIDAEGNAQFRLTEDERCPFLNKRNLCELILNIGEEHLCQICTDHPRFRNFFSDRTEIGLGLCCEAAAILVLSRKEKMQLCENGEREQLTKEEQSLLMLRQKLFSIMQERTKSIEERWENVLSAAGICFPSHTPAQWSEVLFDLERMDACWEERLLALKQCGSFSMTFLSNEALSVAMEQLTCYLLYRHIAGALLDGDICGRIAFSILAAKLIGAIFNQAYAAGNGTISELAEIARQYSSEIEYSEENICSLLDILDESL